MDEILKKISPRRREFLNYLLGTALGAPIFVARDSARAQVAPAPLTTISPRAPSPSPVVTPRPTGTSPTPTGTPKLTPRPTHTPIHTPRPTHMHAPDGPRRARQEHQADANGVPVARS